MPDQQEKINVISDMGTKLVKCGNVIIKLGFVIVFMVGIGLTALTFLVVSENSRTKTFRQLMAAEDYDLDGVPNVFDTDDDNDRVPDEFDRLPGDETVAGVDSNSNDIPDWKEVDSDNASLSEYRY